MNSLKSASAFVAVLFTAVGVFAQSAPKVYTDADVLAEASRSGLECNDNGERTVQTITHHYKFSYQAPTDPENEITYYIVTCPAGTYNESSMLLTPNTYANVLHPVALATPIVKRRKVIGWEASVTTGSLGYDAATHTLTSFSKGRGIGDMSELGRYELYEGRVILRRYEVDQTADLKVNPIVVFKSASR